MGDTFGDATRQWLKVVTVLDCVPGYTSVGDQIAIVTVEHKGEVEQPLMFRRKDVERLARDFMAIAAHHGSDTAKEIMTRYFLRGPDKDNESEAWSGDIKPLEAELFAFKPRRSYSHNDIRRRMKNVNPVATILVKYSHQSSATEHSVYGAYANEQATMVLYRFFGDQPAHAHYSLLKLTPEGDVRAGCHDQTEYLAPHLWHDFFKGMASSPFRLAGRRWTKLGDLELQQLLSGRTFKVV